jgi:superfamily II DNA or RNA helicase
MIPDKTLLIRKKNETYLEILAEDSILSNLNDFFSFFVNGYRFMPKFKMKFWDGKIRLFSLKTNEIYVGLLPHIIEYAKLHEYQIEYNDGELDIEDEFSIQEATEFIEKLKLHVKRESGYVPLVPHQYQFDAFRHAVQSKRCLLLSPTASGKSAILYLLIRYYQERVKGKILLIVPTVNLVQQMYTDFGEYSFADTWDVRDQIHLIYQGQDKGSDKQIYIGTWQSIYKLGIDYFKDFDVILGDECHLAQAASITSILNKSYKAQYRFGTTGTLDGTKVHKLQLEGLFGKVYKVTSTEELMNQGILSQMEIKCLMLYYPDEVCKVMKNATYQEEISYIVEHKGRNKFIRNLALSLKGNTLILFQLVGRHGEILYNDIKAKVGDKRKVFFISGKVPAEDREEFRKLIETEDDAIMVGSYGCVSTGVNIRRLHNIIFASPYKSRIKILQSLGRGLRTSDYKDKLDLYDISDNFQYKSAKNHTLKHFMERIKIYNMEKFVYKMFKVKLSSV